MTTEQKIQKYNNLQEAINKLVFKRTKTSKDFERLEKLYDQQGKLSEDADVKEYLIERFN